MSKSRVSRVLSLALFASLLCGLVIVALGAHANRAVGEVPAAAPVQTEGAPRGEGQSASGALSEADLLPAEPAGESDPGKELPSNRTAASDTFRLPDGSLGTRIYQAPINYRDAAGNWKPIEEGFSKAPDGTIINGANSFDVTLPATLQSSPLKFSVDGQWISSRLVGGEETEPVELSKGVATYESTTGQAGFEYTTLGNGVDERAKIPGPGAPTSYHFVLDTSEGLTPSLDPDGAVRFRGADGKVVAMLAAPVMYDSSAPPTPSSVSNDVHYTLSREGNAAWSLGLVADQSWLESDSRQWPVTIDPAFFIPSPELDCTYNNVSTHVCALSGYEYLTTSAVYHLGGGDEYTRSILRFSTASIPKKAAVIAAEIGLYDEWVPTNTKGAQMLQVKYNWDSSVDWQQTTTFNPSANFWPTPGGDYTSEGAEKTTAAHLVESKAEGKSGEGWWRFSSPSLTAVVDGWAGGWVGNYGVGVKLADETDASECTPSVCYSRALVFNSSANWRGAHPYLYAVYMPGTADGNVVSPKDGTTSPKRFRLVAKWKSGTANGVTFQYRSGEGPWQTIPESQVSDEAGQSVKWPLTYEIGETESKPVYWNAAASGITKPRAKVQIRAIFTGAETLHSDPVEVELNRDLGGLGDAVAPIGPGSVDLLTGNLSISRVDVSIPGFSSGLGFSRSFNSRDAKVEEKGILGPGWKPGFSVEEEGEAAFKSAKEETFTERVELEYEVENEEGEIEFEPGFEEVTYRYMVLTDLEGNKFGFEIDSAGNFVTPPQAAGWTMTWVEGTEHKQFQLADPGGGLTLFEKEATGSGFVPISISRSGGLNKTRLVYELVGGKRRLHMVIGPTAPGVPACNESNYASDVGCHTIVLNYKPANECPGTAPASVGERLCSISYFAANSETTMNAWSVARYEYDTSGRLLAEWNPQAGELKETYSYAAGGQLASITPPGQKPWTMQYGTVAGEEPDGRLLSVGRASLLSSPSEAQWTIAYGVPTSGGGAPYAMSPAEVAKWGQKDLPLDATALFPPTEVPSSPPTSYKQATVYYMDAEGHLDNTATAAGAGTSSPSITTSETDEFGNVIRELSAKNRITALAAGAGSVAKSEELETRRVYEAGTKLVQERGPAHQIRLKGGTTTAARLERVVKYSTETPPAGQAPYVLPIKETTGALPTGGAELLEPRVTETKYNMALRAPEESIVDPEGLNIRTVTRYDKETGLPIETSQPSNAAGGGAGSTKTLYYSAVPGTPGPGCQNLQFAGLPCQITPAAQASGSGRPELTATHFVSYNPLGEPTDVRQSPGGKEEVVRQTISTYDGAGRQTSTKIWGGGSATSKTATDYSGSNGVPIDQRLVCESGCAGFDSQETKVTYDELGRVAKYEDADGAVTETKYDAYGRPTSVTDPRGTQTFHYDETSGLLTSTEVSGVGTFTAGYDADGNLVERGLPNGLTAKTTYNQADEATGLAYTKTSSCGESCTWYEESLERSIEGNILNGTSSLVSDRYAYDKAGRLTEAQETPAGGECTTRAYTYDADSNRLTKTTRNPGVGGACATSGGTTQSYGYDDADRLIGPTYDAWGRITNLSAEFAGGKALTTGYFANNMVATQSQNGVTNTFQLDATGRQRQREQTGGVSGVEIFHYDGQSGSVAWTQLGSTWARNVTGIGGELAAIQESSGTTTFKLTDLHGDVVASASSSPTATALLATYRFDEFGEPESGGAERFGWLGGRARRTELASGVIQMGVRSYIPQLGRFLTPDPVRGGSANAYDYADQDPVNNFDLAGEKLCGNVHGYERCANNATRLHKELVNAHHKYARQQAAASRAAAAQAHHHPTTVFSCACHTASQKSTFESFISGFAGAAVSVGGDLEDVAPKAAIDAFKGAQNWNPERLIQAWQCGWALGEGGDKWEQQCDPVEIVLGKPPESAR